MKNRMMLFLLLLSLAGIVLPCLSSATAAGAGEVSGETEVLLNRMEQQYAGKDFQANFHQISTLTALEITETASGKAFFSHPGKMRWQYTSPNRHEIISDGDTLWIYRPDENQVVTGDAKTFFNAGAGGAFLSDISLVRRQYTAQSEILDDDHVVLILTPRRESADIQSIRIKIQNKTGHIVQVVTANPFDDTTTLDFWNIEFKKMDAGIFQFSPPAGIDIIDMN